MPSVNGRSHLYVTWWQLGFSALQKVALSEKPWRCVQATQLRELSLTKWGHVQRSRVKVNDQGRKITLQELERRCQLVVRLKANKYYQVLLCSLSSYINLLNLLNLQGLCSRLLAPDRFQISSPWSRPLTNPNLKGGACIYTCVFPIVWSVGRNPTALR